ncbi:MAG: hypothetical protein ABI643_01705 [Candidatus Doudnabacteria bacterium]
MKKSKLGFASKLILIFIAELLIAGFVVTPLTKLLLPNITVAVKSWVAILQLAVALSLSLGLVKYFVEFDPKEGYKIGKVLVVLNIALVLAQFFILNPLPLRFTAAILIFDIVRLILSSAITYYACVFILSESR